MTVESSGSDGDDRVVSRRVDNPTEAGPDDERIYRAANPDPDGDTTGTDTGESEPTRSE